MPRIVIAASYHFTWQAPVGILIIFNIEQIDLHFGTLIMQQLLYGSRGGGGGRGSCLYPKIMHDKNCIKISLSQCVCGLFGIIFKFARTALFILMIN